MIPRLVQHPKDHHLQEQAIQILHQVLVPEKINEEFLSGTQNKPSHKMLPLNKQAMGEIHI